MIKTKKSKSTFMTTKHFNAFAMRINFMSCICLIINKKLANQSLKRRHA